MLIERGGFCNFIGLYGEMHQEEFVRSTWMGYQKTAVIGILIKLKQEVNVHLKNLNLIQPSTFVPIGFIMYSAGYHTSFPLI